MAVGTAAIITAIGAILASGSGMAMQGVSDKRAERKTDKMFKAETAKAERESKRAYDLTLSDLRNAREERAREWKWREEERDYKRARDFVDNFTSLMDRQPQFARNLTQVWSR